MYIVVWMNMPSHHQADFFRELSEKCDKLVVCYYGCLSKDRINEGWKTREINFEYERFVSENISSLETIDDWKSAIHIVPGFRTPFLRGLIRRFSNHNVKWYHWSECSSPGWKWYLSYPLKKLFANKINKYSEGALAISLSAKRDFVRWGVDISKISLLPYSIEPDLADGNPEIKQFAKGRRVVLYVGRVSKSKGVDLLLKAFVNELTNGAWCLVIVGSISDNTLKKFVENNGLTDNVLFTGVLSSAKVASCYSAANLFVLPSRYDGWGVVVNEALSSGLPVIVSDAAGSSEHLVENALNGFVFKSDSVKSLSRCLKTYRENESLLSEHGSYSRCIIEKYRPEKVSSKLIKVFKKRK